MKSTLQLFFILFLLSIASSFFWSCGKSEVHYVSRGSISGTIKDGANGNVISGVVITENIDNLNTTSDNSGNFSFSELLPGTRTFTFTHDDYSVQSLELSVESKVDSNYSVSLLNSNLSSNVITIVLTWGETPRDLDSYLYVPTTSSSRTLVYLSNRGDEDRADPPHAYLDRDDTYQYGPETITVRFLSGSTDYNGTYSYFVNKYSSTGDFKDSNAIVRVYKDGSFIREWKASTTATERYWLVFDMASDGTLTSQDTYSDTIPSALY